MLVKIYDKILGSGTKDFYFVVADDIHDAEYIYSKYLHDVAKFNPPEFQETSTRLPIEELRGYYEKGKIYYHSNVAFTSVRQLVIDEILKDLT